jgi:hypothetical protein
MRLLAMLLPDSRAAASVRDTKATGQTKTACGQKELSRYARAVSMISFAHSLQQHVALLRVS